MCLTGRDIGRGESKYNCTMFVIVIEDILRWNWNISWRYSFAFSTLEEAKLPSDFFIECDGLYIRDFVLLYSRDFRRLLIERLVRWFSREIALFLDRTFLSELDKLLYFCLWETSLLIQDFSFPFLGVFIWVGRKIWLKGQWMTMKLIEKYLWGCLLLNQYHSITA